VWDQSRHHSIQVKRATNSPLPLTNEVHPSHPPTIAVVTTVSKSHWRSRLACLCVEWSYAGRRFGLWCAARLVVCWQTVLSFVRSKVGRMLADGFVFGAQQGCRVRCGSKFHLLRASGGRFIVNLQSFLLALLLKVFPPVVDRSTVQSRSTTSNDLNAMHRRPVWWASDLMALRCRGIRGFALVSRW